MRKLLSIAYLICCFTNAGAQNGAPAFNVDEIAAVNLIDTKGHTRSLKMEQGDARLTVFVFLSPECPLCRNYTKVLNELRTEYPDSVKMIGIISGSAYSTAEVNTFSKKFSISYPLYLDMKKELTGYLEAKITPEVVLIDNNGYLVYRGAIDDWVVNPGKTRIKAREYYLRDAINSYLDNKPVAVTYKEPKGCYINEF